MKFDWRDWLATAFSVGFFVGLGYLGYHLFLV